MSDVGEVGAEELLGTQEESLPGAIVNCEGKCQSNVCSPRERRLCTAPDHASFPASSSIPSMTLVPTGRSGFHLRSPVTSSSSRLHERRRVRTKKIDKGQRYHLQGVVAGGVRVDDWHRDVSSGYDGWNLGPGGLTKWPDSASCTRDDKRGLLTL